MVVPTMDLVEAMMFDVPILAYDSSAIAETLGGSGMLLKEKDPVFIAMCLDRVIRDKGLARELVQHQRKRLADFQYEVIAQQFKDYLTKFIRFLYNFI